MCRIIVGLQTTRTDDACVARKDLSSKYFLMTLHFLKCYPTELQLAGIFGINEKLARKLVRFYVKKTREGMLPMFYIVYTGT
jgi:hypothetical protein